MLRSIIAILLISLQLCSCYPIETSRKYNREGTRGIAESKPIYLSFHGKEANYYFLLTKPITKEDYILKVRWYSPYKEKQFAGKKSTLSFLLDNHEMISLEPFTNSKVISYNLEKGGFEEEVSYKLSRQKLDLIAKSKKVDLELVGRHEISTAKLNRYHSLRALRDFLKNSY